LNLNQNIKSILRKIIPKRLMPVIKTSVLKIIYWGTANKCPICRSNIRLLKPFGYDLPVIYEKQITGAGYRHAMCPVCRSSDRTRLLFLFLKSRTKLFTQPVKLLHIAPEKPLTDIFIKHNNINYLSADLNPENAMIKMDITNIQFPDNSFDAILCNHVLEHIPDDRKAMAELLRVLRPAGWAILQVPVSKVLEKTHEDFTITSPQEREKHFGQKDHVRIYGKDYISRLKEAGFTVENYNWSNEPDLENDKNRYGLNRDETVYYCTKTG
jgi:predicted SAM-dependent methyltransferase